MGRGQEKAAARTAEYMAGQPDEKALEIQIRKRYIENWPNTILQLTRRVQGVNNTWSQIMMKIMTVDGLRISYACEDEEFVITIEVHELRDGENNVTRVAEVERHKISVKELVEAAQYIEVLIMDKIADSRIFKNHCK